MNGIAEFVVTRARWAWALALVFSLLVGVIAAETARYLDEQARINRLQMRTEQSAFEMTLQTVNGNLMGALGLLGVVDSQVKLEAQGALPPNNPYVHSLMTNLARAHDADGAFIVGQDGIIKSSWGVGKALTGVDVKFRPYTQMALKGKENVYAAIGTTTGRRNLYFAAPMYAGNTADTPVIGAVVGRTGAIRLDRLLQGRADIAFLLSPQGLVFSSSREEWIGRLAGQATAERIAAIRKLKQFGTMFDNKDPEPLPFPFEGVTIKLDGHLHAMARAEVKWNDPSGEWTLVLLEDLSRSAPLARRIAIGAASSMAVLLIGIMLLQILRGHHGQLVASRQLQEKASAEEAAARRKTLLAEASLRIQQANTLEALVKAALDEAHLIVGALQGAFYVADARHADQLTLAGGYGCPAGLPQAVAYGEGLLGQCAVEARPILMETPAEQYWRISSGLGKAPARMVAALPVLRNETLLGVIELATLNVLDDDALAVFKELLPLVGLSLEILERNRRADEAQRRLGENAVTVEREHLAAMSLAEDAELARPAAMPQKTDVPS